MKAPALFIAHSLKRSRALVLSMGILLSVFQVLLILVAGSIQRSGGFSQIAAMLPPFVREMMGPSIATFMSYAGIVSLGYFHLSVMGSLVGLSIAIATVPASEVETGFIDLILSRPLRRHWIITRTIVVLLVSFTFVLGCMTLGTWIGLSTLSPAGVVRPSVRLIGMLAGNLVLLMLAWGGVALAIAAGSRRRSVAGGITGVMALAMFLLDYIGRLWKPAQSVAWLSPFRYYSPFDLVMGTPLPGKNVLILSAIALAGFAAAYVMFSRRDISH